MTNRDRIRSLSEHELLTMMDGHLDDQYREDPDDIGCILRVLTGECECVEGDWKDCREHIAIWLDEQYSGRW